MIQVKLIRGHIVQIDFGPPVADLNEARIVVKTLDWMFNNGCLPQEFHYYNDSTEIIAVEGDKSWSYMDGDPTGYTDGMWELD